MCRLFWTCLCTWHDGCKVCMIHPDFIHLTPVEWAKHVQTEFYRLKMAGKCKITWNLECHKVSHLSIFNLFVISGQILVPEGEPVIETEMCYPAKAKSSGGCLSTMVIKRWSQYMHLIIWNPEATSFWGLSHYSKPPRSGFIWGSKSKSVEVYMFIYSCKHIVKHIVKHIKKHI